MGIEMNPPPPFEMILDRPLLFLIEDKETRAICSWGSFTIRVETTRLECQHESSPENSATTPSAAYCTSGGSVRFAPQWRR